MNGRDCVPSFAHLREGEKSYRKESSADGGGKMNETPF